MKELLVSKVAPQESALALPPEWRETLEQLIARTPTDKIVRLMEVLSAAEEHMRWSTNKRLHLEMGLIQAVHSLAEANISDIIRALNGAPLPEIPVAVAPAPVAMPAPQPAAPAPAPIPQPAAPAPVQDAPLPADLQPIDDAPPVLDAPPDDMPREDEPPAEYPVDDDIPALREMTPALWDKLIDMLHEKSPVKADMLGNTLFISDDNGMVTVAIHPADTDTRDLLLGDSLSEPMQECAQQLCGRSITLRLVTDAGVPEPVVEEKPAPLPLPVAQPKAPKPKPEKPAEEKAPAPAPPSHKPTDEEFYHDPLVELALKEFHATLLNV